jgi:hypothetical protein
VAGVYAPLYVRGEIRTTRTVPILSTLAEAEWTGAELPGAVDVVRRSRLSGFVKGCQTPAGCMRLRRTDLTGACLRKVKLPYFCLLVESPDAVGQD